jgi:DeoR family glycerol-3-phosphate regulon repressor
MAEQQRAEESKASHGPRQQEILRLVERRGFVAIEDLAHTFSITPQTIRRDINTLCDEGLLRRYHGGAGLPSTVENVAYSARRVLNQEGKRSIGALLAEHIPDQASMFITLGTTAEEAARALTQHNGLRVITNNINVAATMGVHTNIDVMLTGGHVRSRDIGITGETTIDVIEQFKVDYAVFSISGIALDGTLLEYDYPEVRVLRAIAANARKRFLLADYSKIGRNALIRFGGLTDMDALFTDRPPPPELTELLRDSDTALHVAE